MRDDGAMSAPADPTSALAAVAAAPMDDGRIVLIVRRPARGTREVLAEGVLDPELGLEGDTWLERGSKTTADGSADPLRQVTLINSRVLAAIEPDRERWPLAGDQLVVDLDLSIEALPVGTQLSIGEAIVEVTAPPHTGCSQFSDRFGIDALAWISTPVGKAYRMRGMHVRVVQGGVIRTGDVIRRS